MSRAEPEALVEMALLLRGCSERHPSVKEIA